MSSVHSIVVFAFAGFAASCFTPSEATTPLRLRLSCDVPMTTVLLRDVPLGRVVRPAGARFAIGHDSHGLFAFSTVPAGGACEVECGDDDGFRDPCHGGRWDVDGTLLDAAPDANEDLPHLAVHVEGSCDMSAIHVDGYPNEFVIDSAARVAVP